MGDATYDGYRGSELARLFDLPQVDVFDSVTSTLDVAHTLGAAAAPAGTLVLADRQTAGRGRGGRTWMSAPGAGIWLTLLERPVDAEVVDLLAIRLGLRAAGVLERWTEVPVRLKWPNDLYTTGKVSGILVEARWRDGRVDWVAVGMGINLRAPADVPNSAALRADVPRVEVLAELVPVLRAAAAARGALSAGELTAYAERDLARARRCREPVAGVVQGIDERGALIVRTSAGDVGCRSGSLVFEEDV